MSNNKRKINRSSACSCVASDLARAAMLLCWIALALISAPLGAQTRAGYCGVSLPSVLAQPADRGRTGRYVNQVYGYSVGIPPGQHAFVLPDGPERGFLMLLSAEARAFISVDAAYDVFYDITPAGVHQRDLNTVSLHDAVLADESADVRLAGEAARRSLMRLRCSDSADPRVHEEIIAMRNREIYRLDLQTTPERSSTDRTVLETMLKSWRWEPVR
jgi:hypothetical protein